MRRQRLPLDAHAVTGPIICYGETLRGTGDYRSRESASMVTNPCISLEFAEPCAADRSRICIVRCRFSLPVHFSR